MKHKSALIEALIPDLHRTMWIAILSLSLTGFSGCSSSRKSIKFFWEHPPARWTSKTVESRVIDDENTIEPLVAANVPLGTDSTNELPPSTAVKKRSDFESKLKNFEASAQAQLTEEVAKITSIDRSGTDSVDSLADEKEQMPDSSIDRLNAALWDESPSDALPEKSLTALDGRMKIDSLVSQAKRLLEIGQIEQARQIAMTAKDLGDTAQVDYAPDEDRPIDLIRRIDGQLEASRLKKESRSETASTNPTDSSVQQIDIDALEAAQTSSPASEKELSNFSRLRRDWSTLFRREKKVVAQETVPTFTDPKPITPTFSNESEQSATDRPARPAKKSENREAVVVANRSVSLDLTETEIPQPETFVQVNDQLEWIESDSAADAAAVHTEQSSKVGELPDLLDIPMSDPPQIVALNSEKDEIPESDFDVARTSSAPAAPNEGSADNSDSSAEFVRKDEDGAQSNSTGLYVAFGLCGLLAFGYYRRGAT